ncbi:unnamed protein product [Adineta steineri]|nr:unnamed protein product [Adineta steineri]
MFLNSNVQSRVRHYDLLLTRELSFIKREHIQNLITYQKLENSIRRDNEQISNNNRTKISIPFNNIYNERTESIDYHKVCNIGNTTTTTNNNNNNSNQKRRLSSSTSSNMSQNQMDDFDDDTSSYMSMRNRRYSTKSQRLPPMVKATISIGQKRKSKTQHWMTNFQETKRSKENSNEPFTILIEETSSPNLPEPTPLQRQVCSFLDTLPTYKGVQHGFDSFAPASLYSNRTPIAIR